MKQAKTLSTFLLLSVVYLLLWIIGLSLGTALFPSDTLETDVPVIMALALIFLVSALNTAVLMMTIFYSRWSGIKLVSVIAMLIFAIQFFLSQIETLWFNNSLQLPINLIYGLLFSGCFLAVVFSYVAVRVLGKHKRAPSQEVFYKKRPFVRILTRIFVLCVVVYPVLYFLAGYFIAWQFEAVRLHYSDSTTLASFWSIMGENIKNGLWYWQILRGALWIAIAWPVLLMTRGGFLRIGIITGLLFAILMNTQHLLPNPYMPGIIPLAHAMETASSNFIWGFMIVWLLKPERLNPETD